MSLFDSASLIVTPNGYKEDKLYSIKPSDGSGDLVVTRATTATRVNSEGLIEQVPVNLLEQSENFNSATWNKTGVTVTANTTTAPNGTTTADTLVFGAISNEIVQSVGNLVVNETYTLTIYLRVASGTATMYWGNIDYTTQSITVTTEWQRFTVTQQATATTRYPKLVSNGGITVYAWGAQLVSGTSAKEYFPTTDRLDVPRLDYTNSTCPSILVEPQRTNLLNYSEQFNDASWIKTATVNTNTTIAPDGNLTADTFTDSTNAFLDVRKVLTITANSTNTASVFVKKTTGALTNYAGIAILLTGVSTRVDYGIINTTTGAIVRDSSSNINSVSYSTQSYGDYWRVIFTFTDNQSNTGCTYILYPAISSNGTSINSNAQGSNVFWGAQFELGSNVTSYIPTIASSVTRNADVISKTGISSLIGQTEGTLFVDVKTDDAFGNGFGISLSDGTTTNRVVIAKNTGVENVFGIVTISSSNVVSINGSLYNDFQFVKIALVYKSGSTKLFVNGLQIGSSSTTFTLSTLNTLGFDAGGVASFYGNINSLQIYKTALTDQECINLTTI